MINDSQRKKQERKEEQEAAAWLAGLTEIVAVAQDGTQRILTGDEAVDAILRYWEADEAP